MRCLSLFEREELGGSSVSEDEDVRGDPGEGDMRRGMVEKSRVGRGVFVRTDWRTSGSIGGAPRGAKNLRKGMRSKRRDMMVVVSKDSERCKSRRENADDSILLTWHLI